MQRSKLRKLYKNYLEGKEPKKAVPTERGAHPAVRREERAKARKALRASLGQS